MARVGPRPARVRHEGCSCWGTLRAGRQVGSSQRCGGEATPMRRQWKARCTWVEGTREGRPAQRLLAQAQWRARWLAKRMRQARRQPVWLGTRLLPRPPSPAGARPPQRKRRGGVPPAPPAAHLSPRRRQRSTCGWLPPPQSLSPPPGQCTQGRGNPLFEGSY